MAFPNTDISPTPLFLLSLGFNVSSMKEVIVASSPPLIATISAISEFPPAVFIFETTGSFASLGKSLFILSISDCICTCFISVSVPKLNSTITFEFP